MHPFIAASLATTLSRERTAPVRQRRRLRVLHPRTS
jgi:hypothetical protein